jgi:hypothetical protein
VEGKLVPFLAGLPHATDKTFMALYVSGQKKADVMNREGKTELEKARQGQSDLYELGQQQSNAATTGEIEPIAAGGVQSWARAIAVGNISRAWLSSALVDSFGSARPAGEHQNEQRRCAHVPILGHPIFSSQEQMLGLSPSNPRPRHRADDAIKGLMRKAYVDPSRARDRSSDHAGCTSGGTL